jgi:hypothetical protein
MFLAAHRAAASSNSRLIISAKHNTKKVYPVSKQASKQWKQHCLTAKIEKEKKTKI